MFDNLKNNLFNKELHKINSKRKRIVENITIADADSILLLLDISEQNDYQEFENIYTILKKQIANVKAIIYFPNKILPENCIQSANIEYLTIKDINWISIPKTLDNSPILKGKYDLAIDFSHGSNKTIKWILAKADAKCKVGTSNSEDSQITDISVLLEHKISPSHTIKQIEQYLSMFNTKKQ